MKILAVLLLLFGLVVTLFAKNELAAYTAFLFWMGGFVTSEIVSWVFQKRAIKEKDVAQPI